MVDESTGEFKQCVTSGSTEKALKEKTGGKVKVYTAKYLECVTRTCMAIENAVGIKTVCLEDIGKDVKKLMCRKNDLDEKIEKAEKEYMEIDRKGIDLSSAEFILKYYLLHRIAK